MRILIFSTLFFLCVNTAAFASWQKPEFILTDGYREDTRGSGGDFYMQRFAGVFSFQPEDSEISFEFSPFFEGRLDAHSEEWIRKEGGIEIGINLLDWLYLAEAFQHSRLDSEEADIKKDTTEMETRVIASNHLFSFKNRDIKWFLFEEHLFDLDSGEGVRNEIGAGIIIPIFDSLKTRLNWRHIDRVSSYDSDAVECFLEYTF